MNVRTKVGRLLCSALHFALVGPVRACARQRTALPIPWMGPGLAAGLGGSTCTARAAAREQVCPSARMHMPMPAARCPWCSPCLRPISGRHLRAMWSQADLLGGPGAAQSICLAEPRMLPCWLRVAEPVCANCVPTVVGVRGVALSHAACFDRFSGPRWTQVMILGVLEPPNTCSELVVVSI
jgi:hypothetical protein